MVIIVHEVLSRNILYKNDPSLLSAFACSIILMNFSLSCSNPNPEWACSINLSRGPLVSFSPGQPTQKCSSSSTMPELHVLHVLSSTGRQTYLPVSICNGAVPPLRRASRDLCAFTPVLCTSHFKLNSTLVYSQCQNSNSPSLGGRDSRWPHILPLRVRIHHMNLVPPRV